jgi:hypothetical protein
VQTLVESAPAMKVADLIQVDRALESWRDAGYDLSAAVGEVVDNSIEAGARAIRIETVRVIGERGKKGAKGSIGAIAVGDDGTGIAPDILPSSLTLGFSTRYGRREGLGRFGVGAKLAALSQARRVDIYTRPVGRTQIFHTFLDLDHIQSGEQHFLEAESVDGFPAEYAHLMQDDEGAEVESGTLVVWSKVDRLEEGGRFGSSVDERIAELFKFLGRAYRKFIASGIRIVLNDRPVTLHDPLFLLPNPRAIEVLGPDAWRAEVIASEKKEIDGQEFEITVTLLPKAVRLVRGEGGIGGKGQPFKDLYVPENEGRLSILRNGREIYYDIVPRLLPGGVKNQDRFIGIEVAFPATLDEYFQVRHVKRGAEPVSKLRDELRRFLEQPVKTARDKIQEMWTETDIAKRAQESPHDTAIVAFEKMEETAPRGIGGTDLPAEQVEQVYEDAVQDLAGVLGVTDPVEVAKLKEEVRDQTLTVIDEDWPGRQLLDITHVHGRMIMRLNWRHPFMREIYQPVRDLADGKMTLASLSPDEMQRFAQKIEGAIDLLLFSYAKAENQHRHPDEQYGQLRTYWGSFLFDSVQELLQKA